MPSNKESDLLPEDKKPPCPTPAMPEEMNDEWEAWMDHLQAEDLGDIDPATYHRPSEEDDCGDACKL
jgi:hypothetical protein